MTQLASNMLAVFVLALIAESATRLLWRKPAIGHLLWLAVLVRCLLPSLPLLSLWQEQISLRLLPISAATLPASNASGTVATWIPSNLQWLLIAWCAGSLFFAARALRRTLNLRRRVSLGSPAAAASCDQVRRAAAKLKLQAPALITLSSVTAPFLIGLRRPALVLPKRMELGDQNALAAVILHELVHLERRDLWTAWIELLAECLWWWNPIVRYAISQSRRYRELACDARVMELQPEARHAYATALLESASVPSTQALPAELASWVGSGSRIRERLRRLYLEAPNGRASKAGIALVALALTCTLPGFANTDSSASQRQARELTDSDRSNLARFEVTSFEELELRSLERIRATPTDGRSWYELGWAYSGQRDVAASIAAFERQYELAYQPTFASYNLACCYSMQGDIDKALTWLERSIQSGYDNYTSIQQDSDFKNLRKEPRFQALLDSLLSGDSNAAQER